MFDRNSAEFRHLGLFCGSILFFPIPIKPPPPPLLLLLIVVLVLVSLGGIPPVCDGPEMEDNVGDVADDVILEFDDVIDDVGIKSGIVEIVFPSSETMTFPSW